MNRNFFDKNKLYKSILKYGNLELNKNPLISIVIPTYRRKRLLLKTLESILQQKDLTDCEIIIVDNDENLENTEILTEISKYNENRIYYYKNSRNLGVTGNWNRCIELARGQYITMIHDDDYFLENAIFEIKEIIKKYNVDVIHFDPIIKDELKNTFSFEKKEKEIFYIKDYMYLVDPQLLAPIGTTFKRENAISIGGFDESFYPSLDYEFWVRYISRYKGIKIVGNPIAVYRFSENMSLKPEIMKGCFLIDFEIRKKLKNKYLVQYLFSYIEQIGRYKSKKFWWYKEITDFEKKEIEKTIKITNKKYIIYFIFKKLRVFYLWRKYQKCKLNEESKILNKVNLKEKNG